MCLHRPLSFETGIWASAQVVSEVELTCVKALSDSAPPARERAQCLSFIFVCFFLRLLYAALSFLVLPPPFACVLLLVLFYFILLYFIFRLAIQGSSAMGIQDAEELGK
jgi:hypothetical protein